MQSMHSHPLLLRIRQKMASNAEASSYPQHFSCSSISAMDLHTKLRENAYTSHPMHVPENYLKSNLKLDDELPFGVPNSSQSQGFLQDFNYHIDNQFHLCGPPSSNPVFGVQTLSFDCFDHDFDVYECKPFVDQNNSGDSSGHNAQIMDNFQYGAKYSCLNLPQRNQEDMNQSYVAFNYQETKPVDFVVTDEVSCISPSSVNYYGRVGFSYKKNNRASSPTTRRTSFKVRKKSNIVKGQWTIEEDRLLIQLVEQYGLRKWSHIAQMLPGRIGKQCRERWHNHLKPNIKKETWTEEEDKILIEAHGEVGNKWAEIAKRLPGRTENSIKNHWNATKRRQYSKRKCCSKYPTPSLLQEYIRSLNLDQNPPLDYRKRSSSSSAAANNNNNNTTNTITMSISEEAAQLCEPINEDGLVPNSELKDTSDFFCFDESLFQEECSNIECVLHDDDDDDMAEKGFVGFEVKKELDLVEMMSQVNQVTDSSDM